MFTVSIAATSMKLCACPGALLLDVLAEAGIVQADHPCGRLGICGKCMVKIRAGDEWAEVLACQTKVIADMEVDLPERPLSASICVDTATGGQPELMPTVRKVFIDALPGPELCWEQLCSRLGLGGEKTAAANIQVVRELALYVQAAESFTVTLYGEEVVAIEAGDTHRALYGMAFDIGTTTVVGYLFNLAEGSLLATVSGLNPQVSYGADVITRITVAERTAHGLTKLQNSIVTFVDELIGQAVEVAAIGRQDICDLVFVGNPCMQHLFFGINPAGLGRAPYQPVLRESLTFTAYSLGLGVNESAKIHWLPGVAGFVGADTIGMLLAHPIDSDDKIVLALDIGTNGEMVLWSGDRLWACSTAAGPAFEGVSMTCGLRAQAGAIDKVRMTDDDIIYSVIGGSSPAGLCGSGLFAAIAEMINQGLIDESGRLLKPDGASHWRGRFRECDGSLSFVVVPGSQARDGRDIAISQKDIRQLQLAKGAIMAGLRILIKEAGISEKDIQQVIVAGAFGLFLSPRDIMTAGLLPAVLGDKIVPVGNAAGLGAQNALLSSKARQEAREKARRISYIELAGRDDFAEVFLDSLSFRRLTT